MKLLLDTEAQTVTRTDANGTRTVPLYSDEAFDWISDHWLTVGWNQKYSYTFSWMGRPIIQLPEDMVRTQEVLHRVQPDV
ncbi:MAG: CmcI family methyltransferase, partial [Verrucomicrobiota bacterium]